MGQCKDCTYCYIETQFFIKSYYCSNYRVKEATFAGKDRNKTGRVEVSATGSCNYFEAKTTAADVGYKNDGGMCFLTSACVEYLGKQDDCDELTTLRKFRDGYMKNLPDGNTMIKEYYRIAPEIVNRIKCSDNTNEHFQYIYDIVNKCVSLIKKEQNESALNEYVNMVQKLKSEFNIQ